MQNFIVITSLKLWWEQKKICIDSELWLKNRWNGPLAMWQVMVIFMALICPLCSHDRNLTDRTVLIHCGLWGHMATDIWVSIGSGNVLLPDNTKQFTWTNVALSLRSSYNHQMTISHEIPQPPITEIKAHQLTPNLMNLSIPIRWVFYVKFIPI